ncbi:MAG TPA: low molecular weight protein-tyrosine-phosphatase [Burkholderiales bacterium]|jgi:protein-tyrosine phosphatase|nr:low molecular weight protein-tyrosine-phosphatase [Burkholderiales bacterium]
MGERKFATGVLFVCMGNICRSPTALAVFRQMLDEHGLADRVLADSAGTHDYHAGEPPDPRAIKAAAHRGYDLSGLRARVIRRQDFETFDYVLAMDRANLARLRELAPRRYVGKPRLFLEFSSLVPGGELPDPYCAGAEAFEKVLDLVEDAARGLLGEVARKLA